MKKFLAIFVFSFSLLLSQNTNIIDIHQNNSSGEPVMLDQVVTVSGIVTVAAEFGTPGPAAVQDSTGGVAVYGSGFASQVAIGDSVTITATVDFFNGATQLGFGSSSSFTNHGGGYTVEPVVLTLADIVNQAWNGLEAYEGILARINDVTIGASGNFAGSTNYDITDATGSLEIRIDDNVSSIIGTPIPSGEVDIIVNVSQYKFNAPYSSGYQVLPRTSADIIVGSGPQILTPVVASDITPNSFTVYYNTAEDGDSEVEYGLTDALELGSVSIDEDTTYHIVPITGLDPLTTYYFRAVSTNDGGRSEGEIQQVSTSSDNPELGAINVYFNYPVDVSVAMPDNEANGTIDFKAKVLNRINSATESIDIALYSFFGMDDVADAIVAAKDRGVKIRVVYDDRAMQGSMQRLVNAGIQLSQRNITSGIMHNKFAIFDARDTDPVNDWIWTGSWNWTSGELDWRNNVLEINDPNLAEAYEDEFEEMWGSDGDTPNSSLAKFGSFKSNNTIHTFNIGGKEVHLYFSPSDGTETEIVNVIGTADTSIYFALLAFTSNPIFDAIENRYNAGVTDIRGIISDANINGSEFDNLQPISETFQYNLGGKLHHKYGMVDVSNIYSDPAVITGSHNWSNAANTTNDENTLIIKDIHIANQYMQEFKKRYNELGGTTDFVIPVITSVEGETTEILPTDITLNQNYPNPFNPVTTISFTLPERMNIELSVYNMLGEKVAEVYSGERQAGVNFIDFNANNLSSGVYIYNLKTPQGIYSKKLTLLK
ncbi:MAG: hypothetical protein SCALA702_16920 [Melioribacteraceae bacterium]|nr:MAG: hypothetical protein SCALA702_16920 [Melioribacteraceae bacterium]